MNDMTKIDGLKSGIMIRFKSGRYGFIEGKDGQKLNEKEVLIDDYPIRSIFLLYLNKRDLTAVDAMKEKAKLARKALGGTLQELRQDAGLTQKELAKEMTKFKGEGKGDTHQATVSRIERAVTFPHIRSLTRILSILNIDLHYVLSLASEQYEKYESERDC